MSATVYDFHDIPEAKAKWSDMERFHHLRELGLAPVLPHQVRCAECDCNGAKCNWIAEPKADDLIWGLSPCEYSAPDKDPA